MRIATRELASRASDLQNQYFSVKKRAIILFSIISLLATSCVLTSTSRYIEKKLSACFNLRFRGQFSISDCTTLLCSYCFVIYCAVTANILVIHIALDTCAVKFNKVWR